MQIDLPADPLRRPGAASFGVALLLCLALGYASPAVAQCEGCAEARALMDADNCKEAVKILRKAAKGDDASAEATGLLAICRARLGKAKDAAESVRDFLSLESRPAQVIEVTDEVAAHVGKETAEFITFKVDEGVTPPRLLLQPPASFPQAAVELGLTADIIVDGEVDRAGMPRELTVRGMEDSVALEEAGFHEAAANAVNGWRFIPALANGVPVPAQMTCTVHFQVGE